jgi:hypothetical protein
MDMRMEVEAARMRVQHRDGSRCSLQLPVVLAETEHRFPGTAHQGIEDDVGVGQSEPTPFGRQRKGQEKVVGRDEPLHLMFQPLLALVVLTVRAKAMAAGMRHEVVVRTVAALNLHHRTGRAAAVFDRRQRLHLVNAQPVTELREEVGSEFGDEGSEADHRGASWASVNRSISALIRSIA